MANKMSYWEEALYLAELGGFVLRDFLRWIDLMFRYIEVAALKALRYFLKKINLVVEITFGFGAISIWLILSAIIWFVTLIIASIFISPLLLIYTFIKRLFIKKDKELINEHK